jgi:hypothetical protein
MLVAIVTFGANSSPLVSNEKKKQFLTGNAICALFLASASLEPIVALHVAPSVLHPDSWATRIWRAQRLRKGAFFEIRRRSQDITPHVSYPKTKTKSEFEKQRRQFHLAHVSIRIQE